MLRFAPVLLLLMVGCAAERYTPEEKMKLWSDGATEYAVEDTEDGFNLSLFHSRWQFFRSSAAIEKTGKEAMYAIADEVAAERKRPIGDISDRRIKSNMGRTFWGTTSWAAMVRVLWKERSGE
jgi:hypothetical protein